MTQTNDTAQATPKAVAPTNVPFNLIVTNSEANAVKLAKHYDVTTLRNIDELGLPNGGAKRGDALNELLGRFEETVTLVVTTDDTWVKALLDNHPVMAAMVWRSIESKLLGHRTDGQRNLLVVGMDLDAGVRAAQDKGLVRSFTGGSRVSTVWRPSKQAAEKPNRAPALEPTKQKAAQGKPQQPKQAKQPKTETKNQKVDVKTPAQRPAKFDRSKRTPQNNAQIDDLYLACKNHYGHVIPVAAPSVMREVLRFHSGLTQVTDEMIVQQLFHTLVAKAPRSQWGTFAVLRDLTMAGSRGVGEVINELVSQISLIKPTDLAAEPKVNNKLLVRIVGRDGSEPVAEVEEVAETAAA